MKIEVMDGWVAASNDVPFQLPVCVLALESSSHPCDFTGIYKMMLSSSDK